MLILGGVHAAPQGVGHAPILSLVAIVFGLIARLRTLSHCHFIHLNRWRRARYATTYLKEIVSQDLLPRSRRNLGMHRTPNKAEAVQS